MDPYNNYAPLYPAPNNLPRSPGFAGQPFDRKIFSVDLSEVRPVAAKRHSSDAETVFRLLVPESRLSSVMGTASDVQHPSGCRLRLCEAVPHWDERVIVISAKDDRKEDANVAMQGLLESCRRVLSAETVARENRRQNASNPIYTIRLLINRTQAGAVIGKGGILNKDIRERTGAYSKILTTEDIPVCALHNDRVVQVTGSVEQVMAGMEIIAKQLRDNVPKERPGGPPPCLAVLAGFTLYYAHEAPPYIPATDYGRPVLLSALQPTSFPYQAASSPVYAPRPPAGVMPAYTAPVGGPSMHRQPPVMYTAANPGRHSLGGGSAGYYHGRFEN